LTILFAQKVSGQINKSENEFNEHLKLAEAKNINTGITVKAGMRWLREEIS
jgi:hypothetical protein